MLYPERLVKTDNQGEKVYETKRPSDAQAAKELEIAEHKDWLTAKMLSEGARNDEIMAINNLSDDEYYDKFIKPKTENIIEFPGKKNEKKEAAV